MARPQGDDFGSEYQGEVSATADSLIVDGRTIKVLQERDPAKLPWKALEIDIVVASYDRGFDYRKLQIAFDAIWFHRRARLVTTNPDRYCPFPGGRGEPDAGAIVAAIEACTGATCEVNVGKPDPLMLEAAMELLGLGTGDCVLVGDRISTDIRMARGAGMASALVMSGDTTRETLDAAPPGDRPTWVLERLDRLLPPSAWPAG